jgi:hypothetical protein
MRRFWILLALHVCCVSAANTQAIHLTPAPYWAPPETLLEITPGSVQADNLLTQPDVHVRIMDGTMYIYTPSKREQLALGDQTLSEFIEILRLKYPDVGFLSDFLEMKASELAEETFQVTGGKIIIPGRQGRPEIAAALGIGFAAHESRPGAETNTLLRDAGVDIDVIGTKPLGILTVRTRIGLHSAEAFPVSEEQEDSTPSEESISVAQTDEEPDETDPVRGVFEKAQAIALTINFDVAIPYLGSLDPGQFHPSFAVEASQVWALPEAFTFPAIRVNGEQKAVEEVFSTEQIARARGVFERVIPLRTWLAGPRFLFGRPNDRVFYLFTDVGQRTITRRRFGVRYSVDNSTNPPVETPIGITGGIRSDYEWISRVGMGVRFNRIVDVKLDVITPLETSTSGPLLRVMIATPYLRFGR